MYERTYGRNYDRDLTTTEIAARVRKELRRLTKDKSSPLFRLTVSVTRDYYSMGSSIRVAFSAPDAMTHFEHLWDWRKDDSEPNLCTFCNADQNAVRAEWGSRNHWLTPRAQAVQELTSDLLASYNHDGSEMQTDYYDVNFSTSIIFQEPAREGAREGVGAREGARELGGQGGGGSEREAPIEARCDVCGALAVAHDAPHNALRCEAHKNKSNEEQPTNTPEQRYDAEDFRTGNAFLGGFDMNKAIDVLMDKERGL